MKHVFLAIAVCFCVYGCGVDTAATATTAAALKKQELQQAKDSLSHVEQARASARQFQDKMDHAQGQLTEGATD